MPTHDVAKHPPDPHTGHTPAEHKVRRWLMGAALVGLGTLVTICVALHWVLNHAA